MKKVHIAIPVHNQVECLRLCLRSIIKTCPKNMHVAVHIIDNGSQEDIYSCATQEIESGRVKRALPNLEFIWYRYDENVGVTKAWNRGYKCAIDNMADVVCISNSDVIYGPDVIQNCCRAVLDPEYGAGAAFPHSIQGGPLPEDFSARAVAQAQNGLVPASLVVTGGFAGWCFFVSRRAALKVGPFDDQFTLWYQDTDYHCRLKNAGFDPVEVRACLLHHFESRTIVSMPGGFNCHGWRQEDEKRFFKKYPSYGK